MIAYFLSKLIMIFYGMLYPAYCSYKAVKTKDVKEYVHWMMYWIVFSIFSVFEVFADTFVGLWFPFYYEIKILFMIWLLSPTTRGGSTLYRRFVHPFFTKHEPEIDGYLTEFKLRTSSLIVQWGTKAFSYATNFITTQVLRGGLTDQTMMTVTKSYSYENFGASADMNRNNYPILPPMDELDNGRVELPSDMDTAFTRERPAPRQRNLYTSTNFYGSVDEQLGRMAEISKPYSMMDLTEQDDEPMPPPKVRSGSRKKKEENLYGTLPRTKRTNRRTTKQQ
ncbi:uncharacterized protein T19C3.4 isoform X2 [Folsomia candida]|uniref:uncharacterized protein T19C3.4 isoform X2 n=1 Tax=Folsomia candida TaxID=158441 RepID=UPI000B8F0D24|nr:uncharacterized protein T19C3.4 isoform X2 [Folsomia candida]